MVEPVGERAEVVAGVLVELERLVAPANHRLEVAQDGVDPRELRKVAGLALTDDDVRVGAACVNDTGEAVQAVAADVAARQQIGLGPVGDSLAGKAADRGELDPNVVTGIVGGYRSDGGHFVGRATPTHAWAFATEVGIVELHVADKGFHGITLSHGRYQLVVHQPSGAVAGAKVAHEWQRRQPGLVLAGEIDGQEPGALRQLGAVQHRASRQRSLVTARLALEQPAHAVAHIVVFRAVAARAAKSIWPAHRSECRDALLFAAIPGKSGNDTSG